MCQCAERRAALTRSAQALAAGQAAAALSELRGVAASAGADLSQAMRLSAARLRLAQRR